MSVMTTYCPEFLAQIDKKKVEHVRITGHPVERRQIERRRHFLSFTCTITLSVLNSESPVFCSTKSVPLSRETEASTSLNQKDLQSYPSSWKDEHFADSALGPPPLQIASRLRQTTISSTP